MELAELLKRCRQGDELAWEALVRQYQSRVYGLAFHFMRNPEEARDAAQEIFVKLYRGLGSFNETEAFLPWMLRLGRNVCLDLLRRRKARPPAEDLSLDRDDGLELADEAAGPERAAEASSSRRLIHRALGRMSDTHREMIVLKEIEGLKLEEIASMLGLPVGTVKSRSNRARLELARAVRALRTSP